MELADFMRADFKKKKKKPLIANEKSRSLREKEINKERMRKNQERLESKKNLHVLGVVSSTKNQNSNQKHKEMSRCKSSMELHGKYHGMKESLLNEYDELKREQKLNQQKNNFIDINIEDDKFEKIYQDYKNIVENKNNRSQPEDPRQDLNTRKIYQEEKFKKLTKKIEDNFGNKQNYKNAALQNKGEKKLKNDSSKVRLNQQGQKVHSLNKTPDQIDYTNSKGFIIGTNDTPTNNKGHYYYPGDTGNYDSEKPDDFINNKKALGKAQGNNASKNKDMKIEKLNLDKLNNADKMSDSRELKKDSNKEPSGTNKVTKAQKNQNRSVNENHLKKQQQKDQLQHNAPVSNNQKKSQINKSEEGKKLNQYAISNNNRESQKKIKGADNNDKQQQDAQAQQNEFLIEQEDFNLDSVKDNYNKSNKKGNQVKKVYDNKYDQQYDQIEISENKSSNRFEKDKDIFYEKNDLRKNLIQKSDNKGHDDEIKSRKTISILDSQNDQRTEGYTDEEFNDISDISGKMKIVDGAAMYIQKVWRGYLVRKQIYEELESFLKHKEKDRYTEEEIENHIKEAKIQQRKNEIRELASSLPNGVNKISKKTEPQYVVTDKEANNKDHGGDIHKQKKLIKENKEEVREIKEDILNNKKSENGVQQQQIDNSKRQSLRDDKQQSHRQKDEKNIVKQIQQDEFSGRQDNATTGQTDNVKKVNQEKNDNLIDRLNQQHANQIENSKNNILGVNGHTTKNINTGAKTPTPEEHGILSNLQQTESKVVVTDQPWGGSHIQMIDSISDKNQIDGCNNNNVLAQNSKKNQSQLVPGPSVNNGSLTEKSKSELVVDAQNTELNIINEKKAIHDKIAQNKSGSDRHIGKKNSNPEILDTNNLKKQFMKKNSEEVSFSNNIINKGLHGSNTVATIPVKELKNNNTDFAMSKSETTEKTETKEIKEIIEYCNEFAAEQMNQWNEIVKNQNYLKEKSKDKDPINKAIESLKMTSENNLKTIETNIENMKKQSKDGYKNFDFSEIIKKKPVVATERISNLEGGINRENSGGWLRMDSNSTSNKGRRQEPLLHEKIFGKGDLSRDLEEQFFSNKGSDRNLFKSIILKVKKQITKKCLKIWSWMLIRSMRRHS